MKEKLLKNKWLLATIAVSLIAVVAIVLAISFGIASAPKGDDRVYGVGEEGVYYYDVVDGKVVLTLQDGSFTLSGAINKTGIYSVDGQTVALDFFKDDDGTATATLGTNGLTLVYNEASMPFQKEVEFTVNFETNGGSEVAAQKVINGKTATKPVADPAKENNVFLGWYADAEFTTPFAFDTTKVVKDTTVYARWAQRTAGVPDYVVNFVPAYEGAEEIAPVITVSGVAALGLPTPVREGYTFGGWYFSAYENGEKLTYAYKEGAVFTADTTLYAVWYEDGSDKLNAPAVSVVGNTISWNNVAGASSYKLTIVAPDGTVVVDNETVTTTTKQFDFDALDAGEYKVSVVAVANNAEKNSDPADRYVANKTLDKVTDIFVENGILVFGAVENAQKYIITINCGNKNHNHENFDNGTSNTYYLANCEMQKGGIVITITATAKGFAPSTVTYVYEKNLAGVENLKYDAANDCFTWNAVAGAAGYTVTVTVGDNTYTFQLGTVTNFNLGAYTGNIAVAVTPVAKGYNSPDATEATCQKTAPAVPQGLVITGSTLTWDAVEGAVSYEVTIDGQTVSVTENNINIATESFGLIQGEFYSVTVKAINANNEASANSAPVAFGNFVMNSDLTYNKNTVTWSPVLGVEQYQVRVNGGDAFNVIGANSAKVVLTKEGENIIEVRYVYGENISDWASITVTAFAVEYDSRTFTNGIYFIDYLAVGDVLTLPAATDLEFTGHHFSGWYNAPKGALGNGTQYNEGAIFNGNAYTVVYAEWTPNNYNISLNVSGTNFTITNIANGQQETVTYTKNFTLPVPETTGTGMYFFAGWYTGTAGTGVQITDENGVALVPYNYARDMTLFPYFSTNALEFVLQPDGTYAVKKGTTIDKVTNLKIPVTYNEIPVTVVLENAFSSCASLLTVDIPDTIRLVGSGAFGSAKNLTAINVYEAKPGETYETFYSSVDGALIREDVGGVTYLEAFPRGKTGEFVIPNNVEKILTKAFNYAIIDKITIPASINELPKYAFYYCDLNEIVFEGGRTAPITIEANAFIGCDEITSVTLPANLTADFAKLQSMLNTFTSLSSIFVEDGGTEYASLNGYLTDAAKETILYCPIAYAGELSIPQGIYKIGEKAFYNCKNITSVTIPVWVTEVGTSAFEYASGVKSLTFKGGREQALTIRSGAFRLMSGVETIDFEGNGTDALDQGLITIERIAFWSSSLSAPKLHTVNIGDGVNIDSIPEMAFQYHTNLRNFNISEKAHIGSIANKAFDGCKNLTGFTVPATMTNIAANAFLNCTKLSSLTFLTAENEGALTIASGAFTGCTSIRAIELPDRLTEFDASAFEGCTALKSITVLPTNPKYLADANGILYGKNVDENNNVIFTELTFYPKALVKENGGIINNLPETLVTIGGSAFSDNYNLSEIVIPAGVTSIGNFAFANCESLKKVTFTATAAADGATQTLTVGDSAFLNCKSLTDDFRLPSYTTSIGKAAFQGTTFTTFVVPEGVTSIGQAAFYGVTTLKTVEFKSTAGLVIADGTTSAATAGAFANCTGLTEVILSTGVAEIGHYAFYKCLALETVTVPTTGSTLTRIGNSAFEACPALTSIYIPKTVTAIGKSAFKATKTASSSNAGPGSLTSIVFELGGTDYLNIGTTAFPYQVNLTEINFPERVSFMSSTGTTVGTDTNGNKIYKAPVSTLGSSNVTAYYASFEGCTSLKAINIVDEDGYTGLFSSLDGVLYSADKTVLVLCPHANEGIVKDGQPTYEIIVPTSVKLVMNHSFKENSALKTLSFAEFDKNDSKYATQLLKIGQYAASGSTSYIVIGGKDVCSIETINLPSHLGTINSNAFTMNNSPEDLEPMTINFNPDAKNVVIAKYAFYYSTAKELKLPGIQSIAEGAFQYCTKMETLTFVSLASSINAFPTKMLQGAESLKDFVIPAQIKTLNESTFDGCASLTSIDLSNVTKLGKNTFKGTGLISVSIPATFTNPTNLGTYTFDACLSLVSVTFEADENGEYPFTTIPDYFFRNCEALTNINIYDFSEKIVKIGKSAFNKCYSLAPFDFAKFPNLETLDTQAFSYNEGYVRVDLTPTKVTNISTAFNNLPNLVEIIIPETMTADFNSAAFTNDPKLARVVLPSHFNVNYIKNLNKNVVQKSSVAVEIVFPSNHPDYFVDEFGIVYDPSMQTVLFANPSTDLSNYVMPETVITVNASAFAYNPTLKNLVLPEGLITIEKNAFDYSSIESVVIPSTVTSIGDYAFRYTNLREITFVDTVDKPSQLVKFGSGVFSNSKLVEIVIPDKVNDFSSTSSNYFLAYCYDLKSVTTGASMKSIVPAFVAYTPSLEELNLQEGLETIGWIFMTYSNIGQYGEHQLKSVHIPASVKTLGDSAFVGMGGLQTVTFAEGSKLESIGKYAFEACTSLETITGIPSSLATIGNRAFTDCESLTAIDLKDTAVTVISQNMFKNTNNLSEVKLPEGLTTIGDYAFYGSGIKNFEVPGNVSTIGVSAFEGTALETVTFPVTSVLTTLGDAAFKDTTNLETVVLPNILHTIGAQAFENSGVKNVLMADAEIPSGITTIGNGAFRNAKNLTAFDYFAKVTTIGEGAFMNCVNLENATLSDNLVSLGAMAFAFCNKIPAATIPANLIELGGNPYAGLDKSKISVSADNQNFVLETDENGVVTLYDFDKVTIYGIYGLTNTYEFVLGGDAPAYAPGAIAGNKLTTATVPAAFGTVPAYLFAGCTDLTSVVLEDGLTAIGDYAFFMSGLATINIPASVQIIGNAVFMDCDSINNVVIPKTVLGMGNYVFAYCDALSNFEFEQYESNAKTQTVGTHFFFNSKGITKVVLPTSVCITAEDEAASEVYYLSDIPSYMFAGTGIVHAVIPVVAVGDSCYYATRGVFENCTELVSITFTQAPDYSATTYGILNRSRMARGADKLEAVYINCADKSAYTFSHFAGGNWPSLHIVNSVKDAATVALSATTYIDEARNVNYKVYFDADTYVDIIDYLAALKDSWQFQIYDKDGNRLYCSTENGSVAYVENSAGEVIWTADAQAE